MTIAAIDRDALGVARPHVLREYALIADGERGGLIGPQGELVWLCAPRWHSPAIFASLIGGRGVYDVRPSDGWFVWGGSYLPGSLVWVSRWTTPDATIECRHALACPGDPRRMVLLHRIVAVRGDAAVRVRFGPRSDYGRRPVRDLRRFPDGWEGRVGGMAMRWSGLPSADPADDELRADLSVGEGDSVDLMLEVSDKALPHAVPDAGVLWEGTLNWWKRAVPSFDNTIAKQDARHSYAVLLWMTSHTGATVAAATSSLPERSGEGRDYDYRYTWIRDQCLVGQGIAAAGPHPLLESSVRFVSERLLADGPDLRPAYAVDGRPPPPERTLSLPGYPGGTDRVGNHARAQFQLDSFGESLLLLAAGADRDMLDGQGHEAIRVAVDAIAQRWDEPDAGVWELDMHEWTHSRLSCVAGLRAVARVAPASQAAEYGALADRIAAQTAATGVHPAGYWRRTPADDRVDAALLLPALRGALPIEDPRSQATLRAVQRELSVDGYVYRFRHDQRPLGEAEGAFLLCGFIMAMAQQQAGEPVDAARYFERNRAACGPAGLFTEEYDVTQRQLRGNLPQAFVHGALIETATRLAR